jgi:hypothetical protein
MSIENAARKHLGVLTSIGKVGLNIIYPKEFELYLCALELTDENYNTLKYFVFPVMPTNMDETQTTTSNIKKTLGGVVVLNTPSFTPRDITIAGTFGRKFRVLLGDDMMDFASSFTAADGGLSPSSVLGGVGQIFDERIKTGYGCLKILEEIINSANIVDNIGSRRLIFHNPALGNSYLIKPTSLKLSQSQETNMIWSYSLSMKAIALLEHLMSSERLQNERLRLNATGYIQQTTNRAIDAITQMIS